MATIAIDGAAEAVFDSSESPCSDAIIPDLAARAFRDATGASHLLLSHVTSYRMSGVDLDSLTLGCRPIGESDGDPDPAQFNDKEWIASPYTLDGSTVFALVHNEYQGHTHPGQCSSGAYFDCWDNSITLAVSTDGGASFEDVALPPAHLVATPPVVYASDNGPSGYRGPSNIVRGGDRRFYAYFNVSEPGSLDQWVCVMRTKNLADPASWRSFDGKRWTGRFESPYVDASRLPPQLCTPLDRDDIGHQLSDSITFNTHLDRWVLLGLSADQVGEREVWGVYYAFSRDLVEWSRRQLLVEIPLPWTVDDPGNDLSYLYPSLLDVDSGSRNYETADGHAHLYLTRNNFGHASLDRDLIRYPVTIELGP